MNILLWVLQVLAALLYGASGVMKVFMFDKVSEQVPSFGALPRQAWMALGSVLGFLMAFAAYGRMVLKPIFRRAGRLTRGPLWNTKNHPKDALDRRAMGAT